MKEKKLNNSVSNARLLAALLVLVSITVILSSNLILASKILMITAKLELNFSSPLNHFMKPRSLKLAWMLIRKFFKFVL
jgi:hypothetical protein